MMTYLKYSGSHEIRSEWLFNKTMLGKILWKLIQAVANGEEYFVILLEKKYLIPQQKDNSKLSKTLS
jgi:hypothetical protein